jgi:hypothetical protein
MLRYVTCLFLVVGVPAAAKTPIWSSTVTPGRAYHNVSSTWPGTALDTPVERAAPRSSQSLLIQTIRK